MARRVYSYKEALRILGAGDSAVLDAADQASAAALLGLGVFDLFEARATLFELGDRLRRTLGERLRGYDRLSRTERLHAASAVLAIVAVFEVVDEGWRSVDPSGPPRLDRADQVTITGDAEVIGHQLPPAPDAALIARTAEHFLEGLAEWDGLDETRQGRLREFFRHEFGDAVLERFREYQIRLAADCPEFGIWLSLGELDRAQSAVRRGFEGLQTTLDSMSAHRLPDVWRASLSRVHRAVLDDAVTRGDATTNGLRIPTLGEAFVDHRYRVAEDDLAMVSRESWWEHRPVRDNIEEFVAAHLLSEPQAPLLVLGHPGSGKSVLTRVLAARLPADDFLVVHVELRQTSAEADLLDQIETAVRRTLNETVGWAPLVTAAAGAQPVVILDGFDELLQATGVSQSDYLVRVRRFQEREADLGRPVAVIVTSRTAVADRAEIPAGTRVVRLEPFDAAQIEAWLGTWNRANGATLTARGLSTLTVDHVLRFPQLAAQPLLLLMLALYDASANALQTSDASLDTTELYGRLLRDFARREIGKDSGASELDALIERELVELSVAAFAMFNRRAQWVDEAGLNADLTALGLARTRVTAERRRTLTPAQLLIGRFFFVHGSHATQDGEERSTYEFLHATFGEYLIASLTVRLLVEAARLESASAFAVSRPTDDAMLYALLSFECLASRAPIVEFVGGLLAEQPADVRMVIADVLLRLHASALEPRTESALAAYTPSRANLPVRLAAWSANLVILATVAVGELPVRQLFPGGAEAAIEAWHRETKLWRAALRGDNWLAFVSTISVERTWQDGARSLVLRHGRGSGLPPADMTWTLTNGRNLADGVFLLDPEPLLMRANAQVSLGQDIVHHALAPLTNAFPTLSHRMTRLADGRIASPAHILLEALVNPTTEAVDRLRDLVGSRVMQFAEGRRFQEAAATILAAADERALPTTPPRPESAASPLPSP